ncbi:thiamine diphosphokinase [Metasolibacillus fluoroglycofenilyticus]|uniref:thiamine diphosphokinase n=1 Tax=Metasolibacillus fluoroglycofenilyticus TaxID=1239396 RepID=UPI000D39760F|nr:thiamine diphosphokinase [Metasolibacillus fluoroglycofenilyticus]
MIAVICSGGPSEELCSFEPFMDEEDTIFIGADRGAYRLLERGIQPAVIVGDLDSITVSERQKLTQAGVPIEIYAAEKDETDTDLALLKAITYKPEKIVLTGVTGGRLDHYEAVLRTVCRLQQTYSHIVFEIHNLHNQLRFLVPGTHTIQDNLDYPYLSFFAYGEAVQNVTLRGVKYETTDEEIGLWSSRFTSNEIIGEAHITFTSGICLMIRSAD